MWDLLICTLCRNLFENPKILPCLHTFCERCLHGLLKKNADVIMCPSCRAEMKLNTSRIADIPSNFFLSSVLDILKRETNACNEDSACDACSMIGLRNLRCEDCDMLLCTKCLHAHHDSVITPENVNTPAMKQNATITYKHENEHAREKMENERITRVYENEIVYARSEKRQERNGTHDPTRKGISELEAEQRENENKEHEVERARNKIKEYKVERIQDEIKEHKVEPTRTGFAREHHVHMPLKCKRHHREELRFFCNSCSQLLCQDCVVARHLTHIFVSASDAAPSSKAQLNTLLNESTVRLLYLSEALREAKVNDKQLRNCVAEITSTINSVSDTSLDQSKLCVTEENRTLARQSKSTAFNEQNDSPVLYKEALLKDLKTVARTKFNVLAKHRRKLESRLGLIENCQRFTMNLILYGSDEEIIMLENCIMENLGQLCQNIPEVPIECPDDGFITLSWPSQSEPTDSKTSVSGDHKAMMPQCELAGSNTLVSGSELSKRRDEGSGVSRGDQLKFKTGEGCGSCCFATGGGLTSAVVGQDSFFTVTVKNEENKPCIEGQGSIVARIKTPNGGYFRAELLEHKLSKHKFRYCSYIAGLHVLRIMLRGEEILGSPFEVHCNGSTDYSRRGRLVTKFGTLGSGEGELNQPQGLAVDRLNRIYVADTGNHRVQVFDQSGRFLFAFGRKGTKAGEFNEPCDVTIAQTGHVLVADQFNDRIQFFTPDGKFVRQMCCGIAQPTAVTTDQYNNIVITEYTQVLVLTTNGDILRSITRSSSGARLHNVQDVACNQTGETFIISRIPTLNAAATTATHASLIQVYDNNGTYIRKFVTPSYSRTKSNCCRLVTDYDDRVLATGSGNKVQVFTRVGGHLTNISFTEKDCNQIDISAIALSPCEEVVVADAVNGRILVF